MIRLTCPSCQVRLNAKEELAGQTRKCPKCGGMLQIPEAGPGTESLSDDWAGLDDVAPDQHVHAALDHGLPRASAPKQLERTSRYVICDPSKLLAIWEADGQGWMLKTNTGLVKASRNPELLPSEGDHVLVELVMGMTDDGLRLRGIRCYKLAKRWALTTLEQDEHKILSKVTGPGRLTRDQKNVVHKFLREQFMREVWQDAHDVLDYLTNLDYHSPGVG